MFDYDRFLNGDVCIVIESEEEGQEVLDICQNNNVDIFGVSPSDYQFKPYWSINKSKELILSVDCDQVIDDVYAIFTFTEFKEEFALEI